MTGRRPLVVVIAGPSSTEPHTASLDRLLRPVRRQARLIVGSSADELREPLRLADAVFLWDFQSPLLRELWSEARRVQWVHLSSAGVEFALFPELISSPTVVTSSRGIFDNAVAEYALALVLAHAKRLHAVFEARPEARWVPYPTDELSGRVMAILGLGSIGSRLASKAEALGMRVLGVRKSKPETPSTSGGIEVLHGRRGLTRALKTADYVVSCLPLTRETRHFLGPSELMAMKRSAYLVNVGRGGTVDEEALFHALEDGIIAGAALDVFEQEPLSPKSPLWNAPTLLVSPHMAGESTGWEQRVLDLFLHNLQRYRTGKPLLNVVDKKRGY